MYLKARRM